ncbi:hypothetical protein [Amycolatopsis magusensis]|uniref:Mce-associated membrane protein n=1 Tax=Amycolatopsis magusensis TaxID=882444 RepID=A0ABS4Q4A3_9PSEU|nr:hypothetical protein [Amycolatopsis magusensis]MBP2186513.1 Mce-associated membrane protein [Amycolatopsis magusensis]
MTTTEAEPSADVEEPEEIGAESSANVEETAAEAPEEPSRLPTYLIAAAIVLALLGGFFTWQGISLRTADSASNSALVDTGATAEVNSAITTSLNKIFSYSYDKTEVTEKAAATALRGQALETYNQLFGQVRALAPQQKLVLTTRVVSSAVQSLSGDRAQLLVFLDQSATRADNSSSSAAASQLSITAERQDGSWVIVELQPR